MLEKLSAFLFNRYCYLCKKPLAWSDFHICENCLTGLESFKGVVTCSRCGLPLFEEEFNHREKYICGICQHRKFPYSNLIVFGAYRNKLRKLLISYKFKQQFWIAKLLAQLIRDDPRFNSLFRNIDLIIPVPLNYSRLDYRGFNQVYLFAKSLKHAFNEKIKISKWDVVRVKNTNFQKTLSLSGRIKNVRKAFKVVQPGNLKGKNLLILDDIYTTGATIEEFCRILKKAGAGKIKVLIIAR